MDMSGWTAVEHVQEGYPKLCLPEIFVRSAISLGVERLMPSDMKTAHRPGALAQQGNRPPSLRDYNITKQLRDASPGSAHPLSRDPGVPRL